MGLPMHSAPSARSAPACCRPRVKPVRTLQGPMYKLQEDATALQAAVGHFGATGDHDRCELLITHNFVIGWCVRHVLDAPLWRWIGLDQANCEITIVRWDSDLP